MTEYRALPWGEQALLREGIYEEFGRSGWEQPEAGEVPGDPEPEYAPAEPAPGRVTEITDNSLDALMQAGFTVRVVE